MPAVPPLDLSSSPSASPPSASHAHLAAALPPSAESHPLPSPPAISFASPTYRHLVSFDGPWTARGHVPDSPRFELPSLPYPTPAALLHIQLGAPWPSYLAFILRAAASNAGVSFYFLGPELDTRACPNCHRLPLDAPALLARIQAFLHLPATLVNLTPRKLCDLKPMWPALFPELSARHDWIGWSDYDILYGNLSSELSSLTDSDEMLVRKSFAHSPCRAASALKPWSLPSCL